MKKISLSLLCIFLCAMVCFAAPKKENSAPKGAPNPGHRMERQEDFGMERGGVEKLNLSKAQKAKAEEIKKKYRSNYKPGEKPDFSKMRENREKMNKEFRAILTDSQKKQYDKSVSANKAKIKSMISKRYLALADRLKFTDSQRIKLKAYIEKNGTDFMATEKYFQSLLTDSQKKTYEKEKKNIMGRPRKNNQKNKTDRPKPNKNKTN